MSKEQDLSKLRELSYELSRVEACQEKIQSNLESIENNKKKKIAGTSASEEKVRQEVNGKVSRIRCGIITFIQVIATLLMLAVAVYSFMVFIPAMQSAGIELGLYIFFGIIHGAVCLALIILFTFAITLMK